jgi:hypothetical protein
MMLNPLAMPLWVAGLAWLLLSRPARPWRFLGLSYVALIILMMAAGDAKDYYLAPVYPMLFAAGGACWQALLARSRTRWMVPTYALLLTASGILIAPMVLPVLTPQSWLEYTQHMHLRGKAGNTENQKTSDFPQFYADRFGWQEEVDEVARIYNSLPAADRARAGIFCSNYGEASAINFLGSGRGLPFAISGHNSYWMWGPHGVTGDIVIAVVGDTPDELRRKFDSVEIVGRMQHSYAMPYENRNIYLCRRPKPDSGVHWTTAAGWLREKKYI